MIVCGGVDDCRSGDTRIYIALVGNDDLGNIIYVVARSCRIVQFILQSRVGWRQPICFAYEIEKRRHVLTTRLFWDRTERDSRC